MRRGEGWKYWDIVANKLVVIAIITSLICPVFFWLVLQFYLLTSSLECCKSTMTL